MIGIEFVVRSDGHGRGDESTTVMMVGLKCIQESKEDVFD
jgi:hypothetical protein